jgi:hypothetical protein
MRVSILEFLDTDVFNVSVENCVSFLDPLVESWDIDLATFGMDIVLNRRIIPGYAKKFEFVEREPAQSEEEPGLKEFLKHLSVNGGATEEEIEFLIWPNLSNTFAVLLCAAFLLREGSSASGGRGGQHDD